MKTKQLLGAALAIVALVSSCKKDDYRKLEKGSESEVQFTSAIIGNQVTKASGTKWDANDEIGVFMKQGTGLSNVLSANKKYLTQGDGNFKATGSDLINYPETGKVDFIAYYPYVSSVSNNNLGINITDQSNQAKIDVMYSNNATGLDKASGAAKLEFAHKLSKIELLVKTGEGVANLNGLKSVYNGINTVSSMDLATGTIAAGSTAANVNAKITAQNTDQFVEAILIPGDYSAKEVVFTVGTENFKWTLAANTSYESGKKYTYTIVLQSGVTGNKVAVEGTATITDWNAVTGGTINVIKDKGTVTPGPVEGVEQTILAEGFGDIPTGTSTKYRIGNYTGFENKTVKYSDLYTAEYADVRRTSTMDAHVWFPAGRTTGLKIENINATGFTKIKLSYGLAANGANAPVQSIKVRVNGVDKTVSGALGSQNQFVTQTISDLPAGTLTIEFEGLTAENKAGYRVDNIKLVGTK